MKTRVLKMILFGIMAAAALGAVIMLLWNALMPVIFGLVTINFWQAIGLFILARILFGGFRGRRKRMHGGMMDEMHKHNHIRDKWMKMSPEERKEFVKRRREMMHRCHFGKRDFFAGGFDFNENDKSEKEHE